MQAFLSSLFYRFGSAKAGVEKSLVCIIFAFDVAVGSGTKELVRCSLKTSTEGCLPLRVVVGSSEHGVHIERAHVATVGP